MTSRHRPIIRLALLSGIVFSMAMTSPLPSATVKVPSRSGGVALLDSIRPMEVRLRKLHLVRPDLIPYPIEYEVVC